MLSSIQACEGSESEETHLVSEGRGLRERINPGQRAERSLVAVGVHDRRLERQRPERDEHGELRGSGRGGELNTNSVVLN